MSGDAQQTTEEFAALFRHAQPRLTNPINSSNNKNFSVTAEQVNHELNDFLIILLIEDQTPSAEKVNVEQSENSIVQRKIIVPRTEVENFKVIIYL